MNWVEWGGVRSILRQQTIDRFAAQVSAPQVSADQYWRGGSLSAGAEKKGLCRCGEGLDPPKSWKLVRGRTRQ